MTMPIAPITRWRKHPADAQQRQTGDALRRQRAARPRWQSRRRRRRRRRDAVSKPLAPDTDRRKCPTKTKQRHAREAV